MKLRMGFVSNSSSSSFVIPLEYLNEHQIEMIHDHIEISEKHSDHWYNDPMDRWSIYEEDGNLHGSTFLDNFDMEKFLREVVGVLDEHIEWSY